MDHVQDAVADAMNIVVGVMIPFLVMLMTSIFVSKKLIKSKSSMKRKTFNAKARKGLSSNLNFRKEYQFALTTISMNLFYLLIYLPRIVTYLLSVKYTFHSVIQDIKNVLVIDLFRIVSECISFVNYFSIFFTNLAFNYLFKKELKSLVKQVHLKLSLRSKSVST